MNHLPSGPAFPLTLLHVPPFSLPGPQRQTSGVLHSWADGSSGPADGPRWSHHCWGKRGSQGEDCSPPECWGCGQHVPCSAGQHHLQGWFLRCCLIQSKRLLWRECELGVHLLPRYSVVVNLLKRKNSIGWTSWNYYIKDMCIQFYLMLFYRKVNVVK